jgi:hypothetical protein
LDKPTEAVPERNIEVIIPDVEMTGSTPPPPLMQETDSVSTFRLKKIPANNKLD